jgi:hypothetical protein
MRIISPEDIMNTSTPSERIVNPQKLPKSLMNKNWNFLNYDENAHI